MEYRYAGRLSNIRASEIRELLKMTERPEVISFAGGLPASELFPIQEIKEVNDYVLDCCGEQALQYTTTEGFQPLRRWIAERMNSRLGTSFDEDNIMITHGSQQALDLTGKVFLEEGDVVLCESPTYLAAISAFRAYGCRFAEVETDEDGMVISRLEKALEENPEAKLIYIVPDFQNPTGRTWSLARRRQLAELSAKYNVVVIEDNPYGELRYEGDFLPSVKSFDKEGNVQCNTVAQMVISSFLEKYNIDDHIDKIREVYHRRRDAAVDSIERFFPDNIKYTKPEGGLFLWVELDGKVNTTKLLEKCLEQDVAFVPGDSFYPNSGKTNTMRINFSNTQEEKIVEGIRRIGNAIRALYGID